MTRKRFDTPPGTTRAVLDALNEYAARRARVVVRLADGTQLEGVLAGYGFVPSAGLSVLVRNASGEHRIPIANVAAVADVLTNT